MHKPLFMSRNDIIMLIKTAYVGHLIYVMDVLINATIYTTLNIWVLSQFEYLAIFHSNYRETPTLGRD